MRLLSALVSDTDKRHWLLQLLGLLLLFSVLVSSIWLYYDYKVRQLEQHQRQLMTPHP